MFKVCPLEDYEFVTVPAKDKSKSWKTSLINYSLKVRAHRGWKLKPGTYTLVFRYSFSLKEFEKACLCKKHKNSDGPWKKALEITKEFEEKLTVTD